jgi:phosphoglycolate phosphatase
MKTNYRHVIFDLDGTLSDSREGIYNAAYFAMDQLHLPPPTTEQLERMIGPPLQQVFEEVFGLTGKQNEKAVGVFRDYYGTKGLFENHLHAGMKELLQELQVAGALMYVATSKYITYARKILQHFSIYDFFNEVAGADYSGYNATKVNLISGILRNNGIHDPDSVVVIGDTHFDLQAASELEIDAIGVTFGFSSPDEIIRCNPEYVATSVHDLRNILLS